MDTIGVTGGIIAVFLWLLFMVGVVSGWIVSMLTMWRGIKAHGVPAPNIDNQCPEDDQKSSGMPNVR